MWIFQLFWEQFFLWKNFLRSGTIWLVTVFPCFNQEDNKKWVVFNNFFFKSYPIFEKTFNHCTYSKISIITLEYVNFFVIFLGHFWHFFGMKKIHTRIDANKQFLTTLVAQYIFDLNEMPSSKFTYTIGLLHKRVANFSRFLIHFIKSCLNQKLKTKVFLYRKSSLWEC